MMNSIDVVMWTEIAVDSHLQTLNFGRVRAIGSMALYHSNFEVSLDDAR